MKNFSLTFPRKIMAIFVMSILTSMVVAGILPTVSSAGNKKADPFPLPMTVVINEIAWGGTAANDNHEWIELYNKSASDVTLNGWKISSSSPVMEIILDGVIPAGGYFLIEATEIATSVPSAQLFPVGVFLEDSGMSLYLFDSSTTPLLIDTANSTGGAWPAGQNDGIRCTMERIPSFDFETDLTWASNDEIHKNGVDENGNPICGSPKSSNSALKPTPIPTSTFTPTSTTTPSPTNTRESTATPSLARSIIINEIAWMGTFDNNKLPLPNDEWLELYNSTGTTINLDGWKIRSDDSLFFIDLTGEISPKGYFLLERKDDFVISSIKADQVYDSITLSNLSESLRLYDPSGTVIDSANCGGSAWPAGSSITACSMERSGANKSDVPSSWFTRAGGVNTAKAREGNLICGSPRAENWAYMVTATTTGKPSKTPTSTKVIVPSKTKTPTKTIGPTKTKTPTKTIGPTKTRTLTPTKAPTKTKTPTFTPKPTKTNTPDPIPGNFSKISPSQGASSELGFVILSWSSSNNVNYYEYCLDMTDDSHCSGWINTGKQTSVTINSLTQKSAYYWQVRAKNQYGKKYADGSDTAFGVFVTKPSPVYSEHFTSTSKMNSARWFQSSVLLRNGKVLIASGIGSNGYIASSELYDPVKKTWGITGSMLTPRNMISMTVLNDGRILVAGGFNGTTLASAEIYDPVTGIWSETGSMVNPRFNHTATLLPNGKVMVAGGETESNVLSSVEIYNPETGNWTVVGNMGIARTVHTETLMPNGKILIAGGSDSAGWLSSAEIFNPNNNTWTPAAPMLTNHCFHSAVLLNNGKVLIAGAPDDGYSELYDPYSDSWEMTSSMDRVRRNFSMVLLPNGNVLATGGSIWGVYSGTTSSTEIFDPNSNTWAEAASLNFEQGTGTATLLINGEVLVAGGDDYSQSDAADIYSILP